MHIRILQILFLILAMLSWTASGGLFALPQGEIVESGSAVFERPDPATTNNISTLNVITDDQAVINFNSFNIGQNEAVYFIQPTAASKVLGRVTGPGISEIAGILSANGTLFFVNQNGIRFAPSARVKVNNFIASTLDISTNNFVSGNYILEHTLEGVYSQILNEGRITGKNIALVASGVHNTGVIVARAGTAHLASGDKATVSFDQKGLIQVEINEQTSGQVLDLQGNSVKDALANSGTIEAKEVIMNAQTAANIFENAVNQTGIVKATTITQEGGVIRIRSNRNIQVSGTMEAPIGGITVSSEESIAIKADFNTIGNTNIMAYKDINVSANISTIEGDLSLIADADLNGIGSFLQASGTFISTVNYGDIIIQSSGESTLANVVSAGDLILKQGGAAATFTQRTGSRISTVGSLSIGRGVTINAANTLYSIGKDLINSGAFYPQNSRVELVSAKTALIKGSITFNDFKIIVPGKKVLVNAGDTVTTLGVLTLNGSYGNLLTLVSTEPGRQWKILPLGDTDIVYAQIGDCFNARGPPLKVIHSSSLGNNSNLDLDPYWTGQGVSSNWSDPDNWDSGAVPTAFDIVTFDGTSHGIINANPSKNSLIDVSFQGTIASLTIDGYIGKITLGRSLTVTGDIIVKSGSIFSENYGITTIKSQAGSFYIGKDVLISAKSLSLSAFQNIDLFGTIKGNYISLNSLNKDTILHPGSLIDVSTDEAGAAGGRVEILGRNVQLVGAQVKASGRAGGGTVLIGGDFQGAGTASNAATVYVSRDSYIYADATGPGDGGRVIIWSEEDTRYHGHISASGGPGNGNGGFVQVSSALSLEFNGFVNVLALNGERGTFIIDPNGISGYATSLATDLLDYKPGEIVTITGSGFQPGETVSLVIHPQKDSLQDIIIYVLADIQGNILDSSFSPTQSHRGVVFTLTAAGQSSGLAAQTRFTDAVRTSNAIGGTWSVGGTWVGGVAPIATDDAIIATTGANSVTLGAVATIVNLTINSGATLTPGANLLTINGNFVNNGGTLTSGSGGVTIGGTVVAQSIAGFTTTGLVSMTKTAGIATFTGNVNGGGLTINGIGGTLNLGTGLTHTFTGTWTRTNGTLNGGSSTINFSLVNTVFSGTGGTFTAGTGTVGYTNAAAQTFPALTYNNLTLSGGGIKTVATTPTVNGILSLEGTASVVVTTGVVTYGTNATLQYNKPAAYTATAEEWITPFAATGGVIIANTGTITLNLAKVFSASIPLTINEGATLATNNLSVTFNGDFHNSGTFTAGSSPIVLTGAVNQSIDGFSTTGTISVTKTGGTATFTGNINAAAISYTTVAKNGATVSLNTGVAVTLTGALTISRPANGSTSGTTFAVNDGSLACTIITLSGITGGLRTTQLSISTGTVTASGNITTGGVDSFITFTGGGTINAGGTFMTAGSLGTFTPGTGTINYNSAGAQTCTSTTYYNLTKSGAGTLTLGGAVIVNNDLTISAGTLAVGGNNYAITVSGNWLNQGSFTAGTGTVTFNGGSSTITTGGAGAAQEFYKVVVNSTGTKTISGAMMIINVLQVDAGVFAGDNDVTVEGGSVTGNGVINMIDKTFTLQGTGTFGSLTPASSWTFFNLTLGDGVTSSGTATTKQGSNTINITGTLQVKQYHTLWAGDATIWNLTWASYLKSITMIASGYDHTIALTIDGDVFAWGCNAYGQLGNGTTSDALSPVQVLLGEQSGTGYLHSITKIAAGGYQSMALASDGSVYMWGYNEYGQLGNDSTANSSTPVQVHGVNNSGTLTLTSGEIAAGGFESAAISSGFVYCWGYNADGELGNGTTAHSSFPVQVVGELGIGTLSNITQVSIGGAFVLAVTSGGSVYSWGLNEDGELGDGTQNNSLVPVQVVGELGIGTLSNISKVAAGENHSLALTNDGFVYSWGYNGIIVDEVFVAAGQLGNESLAEFSITPVQVHGGEQGGTPLHDVTAISAGAAHSLAIADGFVFSWGSNYYGQLGNDSIDDSSFPVYVHSGTQSETEPNLYNISWIAAGGAQTVALNQNRVFNCGNNENGQLGNGTTVDSVEQIRVQAGSQSGPVIQLIVAGTLEAETSTFNFSNLFQPNLNVAPLTYNNLMFSNSRGTFLLTGTTTVLGNLIIDNAMVSAGSNTLNVSGNWTNTNGTFNAGTGTVTLNGTLLPQSVTSGGSEFNILTITNSNSGGVAFEDRLVTAYLNAGSGVKKLSFVADPSQIHTVKTSFNVSGALGNLIELAPLVAETTWYLAAPVSSLQYLKIGYSHQADTKTISAAYSQDLTGNTNWNITP